MNITAGLLALALLGGDRAKADQAEVRFHVHMMEMQGLQWRSDCFSRLSPVERRGTVTVWTGTTQTLDELGRKSRKTLSAPTITSHAGSPIHVDSLTKRSVVGGMTAYHAFDSHQGMTTALVPQVDQHAEGFEVELTGRPCEQGVVTRLTLDDTRIAAVHSYKVSETNSGDPKHSTLTANVHVPEVIRNHAEGEWLVPKGGVLIVSLGVYTATDAQGKAEVRERVAAIEAESQSGYVEAEAMKASFAADRNPRAVSMAPACPVPAAPCLQQPPDMPAPPVPPLPIGPALILPLAWPTIAPAQESTATRPAPGARKIVAMVLPIPLPAMGLRLSLGVQSNPVAMPMAIPPSRAMPNAIAADGAILELPPLPEEAASVAVEDSSEPRPAPQAKHVPSPRPAPGALVKAAPSPIAIAKTDALELTATTKAGRREIRATWPLELEEAIRFALDQSANVRVFGSEETPLRPICIQQINRELSPEAFRSELAAMIRSVEQQYWALHQAEATCEAREKALNLCEQIMRDGELSPEIVASVERSRVAFLEARSERAVTEKQLCQILGIPATSERRIVASTKMRGDEVAFDVDACLAVQDGTRDGKNSARDTKTDSQAVAASFAIEKAATRIDRQFATTRMIGEVDLNSCGYQAAKKLKPIAKQRLDAAIERYEAKTGSADQVLKAMECWCAVAIQEAEFGAKYQTAIAAVEEMNGTLPEARGVIHCKLADTGK